MADAQTPETESKSSSRNRGQERDVEPTPERHSFREDVGQAARGAQHIASEAAGQTARRTGEAVRDLAETGRRQANQAVETWRNALDPFTAMHMDMNRWFDDLWRRSTGMSAPALRPGGLLGAMGPAPLFGLPAADIRETDDAYLISVELAGLRREDIDLQVRGDLITLSGQKSEDHEDAAASYRMSERRFGRFERSFPVPPDADPGQVEAQFRDGVLKITLPRREQNRPASSRVAIG